MDGGQTRSIRDAVANVETRGYRGKTGVLAGAQALVVVPVSTKEQVGGVSLTLVAGRPEVRCRLCRR